MSDIDLMPCPYCDNPQPVEVVLRHIFQDHPTSDMAVNMAIELAFIEQGVIG